MKLKEWLEQNQDKEIVFEDGKLIITEPEPNSRWKPKYGDGYWYICSDGDICDTNWDDESFDPECYSIGNVFKTEEEADAAYKRLKIRAELLDCGGREKFDPERENWMMSWTGVSQPPVTLFDASCPRALPIYFDSHIEAEEAIKSIGVENIMKYVFGVVE